MATVPPPRRAWIPARTLLVGLVASSFLLSAVPAVGGEAEPAPFPGTNPPPDTDADLHPDPPARPRDGRPRIGLALSGGGALGLAHVGVLQALDELRIPIDAIAGTSMGAVVGAFAALGMPPDEMRTLFESTDWAALFEDAPPRRQRAYRRKEDLAPALVDVELGLTRRGLRPPSGLVSGQRYVFAFDYPDLHATIPGGFDALPTPFRAVATDASTHEMVILDRGNLGRAVRASMAVPGLFAPVEIDGRTLVDGGLTRNLPVDVARAMDVDLVIAVWVGGEEVRDDPVAPAPLTRLLDRVTNMVVVPNTLVQAPHADVLIHPDLGALTPADFQEADAFATLGAIAAREVLHGASNLPRLDPDAWDAWIQAHRRDLPRTFSVDDVTVVNDSRVGKRVIDDRLQLAPGDTLSFRELETTVDRLYGLDLFDRVLLELDDTGGRRVLEVEIEGAHSPPHRFRVGFRLEDDLEGNPAGTARLRHLWIEANRWGAEWRNDLAAGTDRGIATEWLQPVGRARRLFAAVSGVAEDRGRAVHDDGDIAGRYGAQRFEVGLDLGLHPSRDVELRAGVARGRLGTESRIGEIPIDTGDVELGEIRASVAFDRLDELAVPSRGVRLVVAAEVGRTSLGADADHEHLRATLIGAATRGRVTGLVVAMGATDFGSDVPDLAAARLGGPGSVSGVRTGEIAGDVAAAGRVGILVRTGDRSPLGIGPSKVGVWVDAGGAWSGWSEASADDVIASVGIGGFLDTPLVPVALIAAVAEDREPVTYFLLGESLLPLGFTDRR